MTSARHITLWLAAVIVTIAAVLMPSGARAHEGHGSHHGSLPVVSAMAGHADSEAAEAGSAAGGGSFLAAVVSQAVLSTGPHAACAGCPSCTHAPSSCCATGLAPAAAPWPAEPSGSGRAPIRDGPRLSGIVPEAQAEPPRPFA